MGGNPNDFIYLHASILHTIFAHFNLVSFNLHSIHFEKSNDINNLGGIRIEQ